MTVALEPSYSQICTLGMCIANCLCLVWVKSTVFVFRFMLLGWRCGMKFGLSFIVEHSRTCEHGSNTESLNALSGSNGNWCKCLVALDMSHSFKGTKYCWKIDKHSVFNVLAPRKHDWLQTKVRNLHFPLLMVYWEIFPALLVLQMTALNWWELNAIFSKEISLGDCGLLEF